MTFIKYTNDGKAVIQPAALTLSGLEQEETLEMHILENAIVLLKPDMEPVEKAAATYAHKEIAFEFASWISVEFKLYLVKEFERLKTEEMKQLGWDIKRNLAKINYRIHTDAIKENLIPPELSAKQVSMVYASEADVLNMALFGMTAKQWRDSHPDLKGNIRDYANVSQLVCLSNLENLNAVFISEGMSQAERLTKLNAIAISQMEILTQDHRIEALEAHSGELSPRE